jgi:hypothetical protein
MAAMTQLAWPHSSGRGRSAPANCWTRRLREPPRLPIAQPDRKVVMVADVPRCSDRRRGLSARWASPRIDLEHLPDFGILFMGHCEPFAGPGPGTAPASTPLPPRRCRVFPKSIPVGRFAPTCFDSGLTNRSMRKRGAGYCFWERMFTL